MRLPVLLVLIVLAAAGCAGSGASEADYERSVSQASTQVDNSLAFITDNPADREELLQRMDEAALQIDEAAEDLERAGSPEAFEDETTELVGAFRQLAVDLSATADQIRQPDFESFLPGTQGLSFESWTKANEVLRSLNEQGIEAPLLQAH